VTDFTQHNATVNPPRFSEGFGMTEAMRRHMDAAAERRKQQQRQRNADIASEFYAQGRIHRNTRTQRHE